MRGERIAAPIFALLIVFSGAGIAPGVSPVGTADAQLLGGSDCTFEDAFLEAVSFGVLEDNCGDVGALKEEWNETDADQTRTQIHSQAGQLAAGNEQFLTVQQNYLTDSDTIAFSEGEAAAVEVLANGGSISEAQTAANESIDDYYTVKQINMLDRWDVAVETIVTQKQRAIATTGVDSDFVTAGNENGLFAGDSGYQDGSTVYNQTNNVSKTLLNGTTVTTKQIGVTVANPQYYDGNNQWVGIETGKTSYDAPDFYITKAAVRPTDNLSAKTQLDFVKWSNDYKEIRQKSTQTKQEVSVYVEESLGPAVQNGELNATSYVSPATLAQEYAQDYNGSESYIRATAMAAFSGMDTPSLNETGSMTVTHDGQTYKGLLLSQEAPSGGWQSGESYDPALLSGVQMIAVAGDNGSIVELDGSFTVDKITGTSGEEISKATTVNVTYETSNASANYTELQQQIRQLNEQIEEREAQAISGAGGDSGPELPSETVLIGAAVAIAAAAAYSRQ